MPLDDVSLCLCRDACEQGSVALIGPRGRQAEIALDKRLQLEAAAAAGFAVPSTSFLGATRSEEELEFPLVVRPAVAARQRAGRLAASSGAVTCADATELERALAAFDEDEAPMAQPQLRGTGEGIFGLATPGGVRAWSAHRRVRMMNPAFTASWICCAAPLGSSITAKAA